jgi:hypothetical protein
MEMRVLCLHINLVYTLTYTTPTRQCEFKILSEGFPLFAIILFPRNTKQCETDGCLSKFYLFQQNIKHGKSNLRLFHETESNQSFVTPSKQASLISFRETGNMENNSF